MPELDPASDFRDDGGTPAWRANQATYARRYRRPVSGVELIGWCLIFPFLGIMGFYVLALLLGFMLGLPIWLAIPIALGAILYLPVNYLRHRR